MTKPKKSKITQEELKEILIYNPENGIFTWKVDIGRRLKAGSIAGCLEPNKYWVIRYQGRRYYAHRLAWLLTYGELPIKFIDHKDRVRSNNRINNLRECSRSKNAMNQGIPSNNTSGFKGVSWNSEINKWYALCTGINGRENLGSFDTPEEASKAYNDFASVHHGEFYKDTTGGKG